MNASKITRVTIVSVLVGALALLSTASAGDLNPPGPPYPTMKTLDQVEPRIPLSQATAPGDASYHFVISERGSYFLTSDINLFLSGKSGIKVDAYDVTIDLAGYTLKGPATGILNIGVYMSGEKNVEIRNGVIRDFNNYGIYESGTTGENHRIIDVRVVSNQGHGIHLRGDGHRIQDCIVSKNEGYGIRIETTTRGCSVVRTMARDNLGGAGIYVGEGCLVSGNTATGNQKGGTQPDAQDGTGIITGRGCTVCENVASENANMGILALGGATVVGNAAYMNGGHGIYLNGSCLVDQNYSISNGASNIHDNTMSSTFGVNHAP